MKKISYARLVGMLYENLQAWEGEEESVQSEHKRLIIRTRALLERAENDMEVK